MSHLQIERDGHVVTCRMSNPPQHTLVAEEVAELAAFVADAGDDVRVVVFTGGGEGVFIAHYEVGELAAASGAARPASAEALHAMHRLLLLIESAPWVSVAAMNGSAAGGGFEFALACDFRLTSEGPWRFGLPETSVGIIPGAGGTQRLPRLIGTARALDLILHAQLLDPHEALDLGLVHRLWPQAAFATEVAAFAADLAARAPLALRAARRAIRAGVQLPLEAALAVEQREFDRVMASEDAATAMRAWLQGERWEWKGR
ncbi:MAG TPA: enoyl-CoA hydratase/isomerase family protein [Pseudomonadales bacterium]|nr:enoyl-CoA hydratase/isomerase family protein [Pseudomonadales bacterium]